MNENRNDLRLEIKWKMREFIDLVEDKYCDGCPLLHVEPPFKGATGSNINPWRDSYKCKCNYFNMVWLNNKKDKIPRCLECILSESKHSFGDA